MGFKKDLRERKIGKLPRLVFIGTSRQQKKLRASVLAISKTPLGKALLRAGKEDARHFGLAISQEQARSSAGRLKAANIGVEDKNNPIAFPKRKVR